MAVLALGEQGFSWAVWAGGFSDSFAMEFSGLGAGQWHVGLVEAVPPAKFRNGVLRALDPDSESEAEVVEDPCQAVQVGLELQGVTKALAVEDCSDRAASEPTRLLDRDQELSDLGGSSVARLCNHHSQLYMLSVNQGRKCSVLSCYGAVPYAGNILRRPREV